MSGRKPALTLDAATASTIYELFRNVSYADEHFRTCQSQNFRQHVRAVYTSRTMQEAFGKIKAFLEADGDDKNG